MGPLYLGKMGTFVNFRYINNLAYLYYDISAGELVLAPYRPDEAADVPQHPLHPPPRPRWRGRGTPPPATTPPTSSALASASPAPGAVTETRTVLTALMNR